MELGLPIFFVLIVIYALFAARLDNLSITMPMVFVSVGALLGPSALDVLEYRYSTPVLKQVTEVTLALLLFADASSLDFRQVNEDKWLPARLLLIALPLTILLGGVTMMLIFPLEGIAFAFLVGAILAPTDAALGMPIFTNLKVPTRIRRALTVESGLNDGLATPFVTLFAILAVTELGISIGHPVEEALLDIGIAIAVAILVGAGLGLPFAKASERGWTSRPAQLIAGVALPLAAYFTSVALGGNGFIAAFIGGLLFGRFSRKYGRESSESAETLGTLLSLFVWTAFGILVVGPILAEFNVYSILFALLALTVVRILPVAVSMLGMRFRLDTLILMGWFGPRGLASVVFTIIALESFAAAGRQIQSLVSVAGWTILLSVLLHGFTAGPLASLYARRLKDRSPEAPEFKEVSEIGVLRSQLGKKAGATPPSHAR